MAAIGSALLWAVNSVMVRPLAQRLPALRITALQYLCSAICMLAAAAALNKFALTVAIPPEQALGLVLSALTGMGMGDTAYVRALSLAGVARTYPVSQAAYVLFTFVFSALLLSEPLTPRVAGGTALLLAGVGLLSRSAGEAPSGGPVSGPPVRTGLAIALFAGLCWAFTTALVKLSINGLDLLAANALRIPAVALALNTVAWTRFGADFRSLGARSLALIALAGVAGLWLSSLLFMFALSDAGATKTAVLSSTSPLFASAMAVLFLRERLTPVVAAGTVLTVAGMIIVV